MDLVPPHIANSSDGARYSMLIMIDYGSFGDVYKVKDHTNKRICALKQIRIRRDFREDPYIISELYCLTHLTHRNVVKLYEIVVDTGEINIIMEYAENENLQRYFDLNESLEFHQIHQIYSQLLDGVRYCHSMDVAHRDLTPANILLTEDMVVKIADFGLAVRCFTQEGIPLMCTDYLGHASYLAPEVLARTPFLPKPTDIWSLGITLLWLLFRQTPVQSFEPETSGNESKHSWRTIIGGTSLSPDSCLKEDLVRFIDKALEVFPHSRSSICDLVRSWGAVDGTSYLQNET